MCHLPARHISLMSVMKMGSSCCTNISRKLTQNMLPTFKNHDCPIFILMTCGSCNKTTALQFSLKVVFMHVPQMQGEICLTQRCFPLSSTTEMNPSAPSFCPHTISEHFFMGVRSVEGISHLRIYFKCQHFQKDTRYLRSILQQENINKDVVILYLVWCWRGNKWRSLARREQITFLAVPQAPIFSG